MDITNQVQNILSKAGNFIHGKDSEDNEIYSSIVEWKQESGLLAASANADASNNNCNDDTTKHASTVIEQNSNSQPPNRQEWYKTGYDYWEDEANCPATVDGVLGGFACLSQRDLKGSNKFLTDLKSQIRPELKFSMEENEGLPTCACECGAGV